jgi:phage shock protein A
VIRVQSWLVVLLRRLALRVLDDLDDPRETLDYAYQRQLELQQTMRRGLAEVITTRRRLALVARDLEGSIENLEVRSRIAVEQQRETTAREALTHRAMLRAELADLQVNEQALAFQEAKMTEASRLLDFQVRQFRTRREAARATYSAVQARALVSESLIGLNGGPDESLLALHHAQDQLVASQARSDALDALLTSGPLRQPILSGDSFHPEFDMGYVEAEVAAELARLKADGAHEAPSGLDQAKQQLGGAVD